MKKIKKILIMIFIVLLIIILISVGVLLITKQLSFKSEKVVLSHFDNSNVLYAETYKNFSWGYAESEYCIYSDGRIMWYSYQNDYPTKEGEARLTEQELSDLIKAINKTHAIMWKSSTVVTDAGGGNGMVYHTKSQRFVSFGCSDNGEEYYNIDRSTKKCEEMISELFKKYSATAKVLYQSDDVKSKGMEYGRVQERILIDGTIAYFESNRGKVIEEWSAQLSDDDLSDLIELAQNVEENMESNKIEKESYDYSWKEVNVYHPVTQQEVVLYSLRDYDISKKLEKVSIDENAQKFMQMVDGLFKKYRNTNP